MGRLRTANVGPMSGLAALKHQMEHSAEEALKQIPTQNIGTVKFARLLKAVVANFNRCRGTDEGSEGPQNEEQRHKGLESSTVFTPLDHLKASLTPFDGDRPV